jgi:hypothetical protein
MRVSHPLNSSSGCGCETNGYASAYDRTTGPCVFNAVANGSELADVRITMDNNSSPRSAHLGVFVVMGIAPIVVYLMAVLVLPWIVKGLH